MVSLGSLLLCDAMFFSVGSQFFGKKCIFLEIGIFIFILSQFLCIFHYYKTIQGFWMDLYTDVDPYDQARCTQVTYL